MGISFVKKIYQDKEQTYSIRILCLDMLAKIEEQGTNPLIKDAIQNTLENTDFIELEYLKKSITILQNYNDPEATKSLVAGLANSENKIMDLRETIIRSIETNGTIELPEGLIDWICVSPKAGAPLKCTHGDELKLVFPQIGLKPDFFQDLDFNNFLLQPMSGSNLAANTAAAAEYCYVNPKWLLSLQVHKFADIP